ncbi:hypothetical protein Dfri01_39140 [Dyadobacter frigoris]|uniref:hypothetical protein n=1 Tax=Dyadobacter frigoris TaxID=2576211 RepID=UPI0024A1D9DE|nr:hypothetical protein [Dyadobacter frigoris]GLU54453.1 hypothetical protein Dfri01_39140 [Dyadobacter frigoris]
MVIKISGADYSANPVRQIDIPVEFEAETTAYATRIPVAYAAMTATKKKALNTFIKGLKTNGLLAKINGLYLPIFGQTEGGVNLKTPTFNVGLPASGVVATYDSKGILFLQGWLYPPNESWADIHCGFYNTTSNADNSGFRIGWGKSGQTFSLANRRGNSSSTGLLFATGWTAQLPNHVASIGPVIGSHISATKFIGCAIDGEYTENISTSTLPTFSAATIIGGTAVGANTNALAQPIGLLTTGTALNQAQATTYAALQTTLMTALMA